MRWCGNIGCCRHSRISKIVSPELFNRYPEMFRYRLDRRSLRVEAFTDNNAMDCRLQGLRPFFLAEQLAQIICIRVGPFH
ncbi:hypothetical protein Y043_6054 [Burkholderia pseudomallei MSHR2138]|nr:hypothetical protein X890_5670 [Burkholderia pseudomallei MSHR4299]KGX48478.1 hypothetical protein Y043_6054 [Burkholderia pseudomallei MSHR2138]KGX48576.1 hypothetical protein Y600_6357 [Burkholderia pseudomallei MSHR3709]